MRTSVQPDLTLIFVNYRSVALLERAIRSLGYPGRSIGRTEIIVANNDVHESLSVAKLSDRLGFRMVGNPGNSGFGAAANRAASEAVGDILGFLNPDTELFAGSTDSVIRMFKEHPEVGIIGAGLVSGDDGVPEPWSIGEPLSVYRLLWNKVIARLSPHPRAFGRPKSVGWVSGGALFIRRELFESLSGFDEAFFLYFEDMDLCVRASFVGYRTVFYPRLKFVHAGGASRLSDQSRKAYYFESQDRYFFKHRPKWEGVLVRRIRSFCRNV